MLTSNLRIKLAMAITMSLIAVVTLPVAAADPQQQIALLTLGGSGLPPGPLNSYSFEDPKTRGTFIHQELWQLIGQDQIPSTAVITEVRFNRIASGTFGPGLLQAQMRPAMSNGVDLVQVPTGAFGAPPDTQPLEVYGVNAYVVGGTNVFTANPFTGQPWQRGDLDTLFAGFWARWENTSATPISAQHLSFSDYTIEVVYQSVTLTFTSQNPLYLSTGDTGRFVTTLGAPPTVQYTPSFSVGSRSAPHADCKAEIVFAPSTGTGSVNSGVTAGPPGCGVIADGVSATVDQTLSTNTTKIVVPPQIMIRTIVGEAGGQPGDIDQQALLSTAFNRFGVKGFQGARARDADGHPGGTWDAVLTAPKQYLGSSDPTADGPQRPLLNAAKLFTGEVGDIVGGAPCYYSPTFQQFQYIVQALQSGQTLFPSGAGGPKCYQAPVRQILVKESVGQNQTSGGVFAGAPAFVFIRERRKQDPAVVLIP